MTLPVYNISPTLNHSKIIALAAMFYQYLPFSKEVFFPRATDFKMKLVRPKKYDLSASPLIAVRTNSFLCSHRNRLLPEILSKISEFAAEDVEILSGVESSVSYLTRDLDKQNKGLPVNSLPSPFYFLIFSPFPNKGFLVSSTSVRAVQYLAQFKAQSC